VIDRSPARSHQQRKAERCQPEVLDVAHGEAAAHAGQREHDSETRADRRGHQQSAGFGSKPFEVRRRVETDQAEDTGPRRRQQDQQEQVLDGDAGRQKTVQIARYIREIDADQHCDDRRNGNQTIRAREPGDAPYERRRPTHGGRDRQPRRSRPGNALRRDRYSVVHQRVTVRRRTQGVQQPFRAPARRRMARPEGNVGGFGSLTTPAARICLRSTREKSANTRPFLGQPRIGSLGPADLREIPARPACRGMARFVLCPASHPVGFVLVPQRANLPCGSSI
jgi:hypothetical protein